MKRVIITGSILSVLMFGCGDNPGDRYSGARTDTMVERVYNRSALVNALCSQKTIKRLVTELEEGGWGVDTRRNEHLAIIAADTYLRRCK